MKQKKIRKEINLIEINMKNLQIMKTINKLLNIINSKSSEREILELSAIKQKSTVV